MPDRGPGQGADPPDDAAVASLWGAEDLRPPGIPELHLAAFDGPMDAGTTCYTKTQ
jgi:hypothetical protein